MDIRRGIKFPLGFPGRSLSVPREKTGTRAVNVMPPSSRKILDLTERWYSGNEGCKICDRPKTHIHCAACLWQGFNVRVRKICPDHVKVEYLHDLVLCPACKTNNLQEGPGISATEEMEFE